MYWCEFFLPRRLLWLCFDMLTIVCVLVKANFMANNNRSDYTHIQKHTSIYIYTHTHTYTLRQRHVVMNENALIIYFMVYWEVFMRISPFTIIITAAIIIIIYRNFRFGTIECAFIPIALSCPRNCTKYMLWTNGDMQHCTMGINDRIHL